MKFIILALIVLCGCASFELADTGYSLPEIVNQSPLPPWPFHTDNVSLVLKFKIHISGDGTVDNAIIETPSGNKEWDALALTQIRTWRYSPALMDGRPTSLWLRQSITLHFDKPLIMEIAELICPDQTLADSLYSLLITGSSFDSLARQFSSSESSSRGGNVGVIDLHTLPVKIYQEVAKLQGGQVTKPLKLGRQFVIYKRLSDGA
jgi:TonB family protein